MWPDVDEMVRILEAGVNIVTTAAFITGQSLGEDKRARIAAACERGRSSIFGTGISPGFVELLAMVMAGACDLIDKVTVSESADTTAYDSPATEIPVGFGRPIGDPELPAMTRHGTAVFGDAVCMVGDALGVDFDEVRCEAEYAKTTVDLDLGSWKIPAGGVAGVAASWQGRIGGKTIVELRVRWRKGFSLEPDWQLDPHAWVVEVQGRPTLTAKIEIMPPPDFQATSFQDFMVLGLILTAMPAVNAIPRVVTAPPGIVTYKDIPLPLPRGYVAR
jgi:hypothetical protein